MNKRQQLLHKQAVELLENSRLTQAERLFVCDHYLETATGQNALASAHFTPYEIANNFSVNIEGFLSVVDLCAGIGILGLPHYFKSLWDKSQLRYVCVEACQEYVEIGSKLFPVAEWVHGDVTDKALISSLGHFRGAVANPPFGKTVKPSCPPPLYTGTEFEYIVMDIAADIADHGAFIIPQASSPFVLSGGHKFQDGRSDFRDGSYNFAQNMKKYGRFHKETKIHLEPGVSVDYADYKKQWKGVAPQIEVVTADFEEIRKQRQLAINFPNLDESPLFAAA